MWIGHLCGENWSMATLCIDQTIRLCDILDSRHYIQTVNKYILDARHTYILTVKKDILDAR